ncbi:Sirohydrochlorin ferrochelatase [Halobacillus karajensis]|uniref:Sirohydrochlorin ferrochelatase n=2 Tax=Halobacillus karajensis TaxID=195088 RepID=A0A024P4J1_9BACI|nr:sirohydrochlorin chelatase [Halobacillus karajensis]CDQ20735.1 Sirohydrochlorin ferrochelatase [Halobacillus karajensis]CDQ23795.1 Sirohydrochlorin ferrochelatase [Halobacillus karajensis]CDQ27273.1 Sirohydrochlorin ferrochelatase [Halobacillus karajensis]
MCAKRAKEIAIVPVLLLTAVHAKKDIPDVLNRAKKIYPNVEFTYGRPLGIQKRLVDVLVEHIEKERETPNDMHLLLVGRGSSDEEAVEDTKRIARLLEQRVNVHVHVCFLAAVHPHFEKKLQAIISGGAHHIVILPYLLFTGLLMKDIKDTVHEFQSKKQKVTVCDYLGGHRNVPHALRDRVLELI